MSELGPAGRHIPVLLAEVARVLGPRAGEVYADATAGLGGHAAAIAPSLLPGGAVVLNDLDPGNLARAGEAVRRGGDVRVEAVHGNFADLPAALLGHDLAADLLLADLGFASSQVDDPARGLSFRSDGPLDMRLDPGGAVTAADLVRDMGERELAETLWQMGEERHARRIAAKIAERRAQTPLTTTGELARVVRAAVPSTRGPQRIDPATRTFQALRIAVNDELGSLEALLRRIGEAAEDIASGTPAWLRPGARAAFITFHSLEDRPIKRAFRSLVGAGLAHAITRKPITAGDEETGLNPRARSAKLRAIRLGGPA